MHTGSRKLILGLLVLIVAIALGAVVWLMLSGGSHPAAAPATTSYTSTQYGYSFSYPAQYSVDEYSPDYVAVGTSPGPDAFDAVANVDLVSATTDDGFASFAKFIHTRAMNDCAADGPGESISCTAVASSSPFTTTSGLTGEEFYLTQVDTKGSESTSSVRGPFYAFDISASQPKAEYAALLIHVPTVGDDSANAAVVSTIAASLSAPATTVSTGTGQPIATATDDSNWMAGMQVIARGDMDTTFTFAKNERFVIQMGTDLNWTISFDPAAIISRVANSTTAGGVQGVYEASAVGTTTLHATGAPICKAGEACPQFLVSVPVNIVVK